MSAIGLDGALIEAHNLHRDLLDFYRVEFKRGSWPVRLPERRVARVFGLDAPIVMAVWPVVPFVMAIDDLRQGDSADPCDRLEKEQLIAEEARIFLLLRDGSSLTLEDKREVFASIATEIAVRRGAKSADQERFAEDVEKALDGKMADALLRYRPGSIRELIAYFKTIVRNRARGLPQSVTRTSTGVGEQGATESCLTETLPTPPGTYRSLLSRGRITRGTPAHEVSAIRNQGIQKKAHRPDSAALRTIAQLSEVWPYGETAIRGALRRAEKRWGERCPRDPAGRYAWLSRGWEARLLEELGLPKGRDNLFRLAREVGRPLIDVILIAEDVLEREQLDPKQFRVHADDWDEIVRRCERRRSDVTS